MAIASWLCSMGQKGFSSSRTREDGFKIKGSIFRLGDGKIFYTQRVVRHWKGLPRRLWMPYVQRHLRPDGCSVGILSCWGQPCPWQGEAGTVRSLRSLQPQPSYDSMRASEEFAPKQYSSSNPTTLEDQGVSTFRNVHFF